jgi:hypothetical protein
MSGFTGRYLEAGEPGFEETVLGRVFDGDPEGDLIELLDHSHPVGA